MIVIIDYGLGNLRSVQKAFERIDNNAVISSNIEVISKADKLVLPGVGYFAIGIKNLKELGLIEVVNDRVLSAKVPILGICLGMQLMTNYSEEGEVDGLGWVNANTKHFSGSTTGGHLKIPHMGWNDLTDVKPHNFFNQIIPDDQFYFVHSYYVTCMNQENSLSKSKYGFEFDSAIIKDNIIGVQFHPEKSHRAGLALLRNFAKL